MFSKSLSGDLKRAKKKKKAIKGKLQNLDVIGGGIRLHEAILAWLFIGALVYKV